jgi:hypothetical protein
MTAPEQPVGGEDYGYDLAHDVPGRRPRADEEPGEQRRRPNPRPVASGGDWAYDEAHDHP